MLDGLAARGLTYPCFCSRADVARAADCAARPGRRAGLPRHLPRPAGRPTAPERITAGAPFAVRLDVSRRALAERVALPLAYAEEATVGTGALRPGCASATWCWPAATPRAATTSASTHDDAAQGVTLVTRGEDLRAATDVQRLLQALMGWPAPRYAHHRLLTDASGRRLAKRDGCGQPAGAARGGRDAAGRAPDGRLTTPASARELRPDGCEFGAPGVGGFGEGEPE